jgi:hypothetical protein
MSTSQWNELMKTLYKVQTETGVAKKESKSATEEMTPFERQK